MYLHATQSYSFSEKLMLAFEHVNEGIGRVSPRQSGQTGADHSERYLLPDAVG